MDVLIYALKDPRTKEIRYVGKTKNLQCRIRTHRFEANNPKFTTHKANWLRSLNSDPMVEVIETATIDNWADRERYWIKELRSRGYNLTNIADGGQTSPVEGKGHSEETKLKLSLLAKARGDKPPSRAGQVPWNKGTKGRSKANISSFKQGRTPWNKKTINLTNNLIGEL